jgi:hypothetical protein
LTAAGTGRHRDAYSTSAGKVHLPANTFSAKSPSIRSAGPFRAASASSARHSRRIAMTVVHRMETDNFDLFGHGGQKFAT